jgi:hypothetical protein
MRYWNRLSDPDKPRARSRSPIIPALGTARSQWGQRPLFSVPGPDQPPPEEGRLGSEARLDGITPTDESVGSEARTALITEGAYIPVILTNSKDNVTSTPTEADLEAAFGPKPVGFIAIVIDGGGAGQVTLVVRSKSSLWWFEKLTRAS